jgi:hypothetical protein
MSNVYALSLTITLQELRKTQTTEVCTKKDHHIVEKVEQQVLYQTDMVQATLGAHINLYYFSKHFFSSPFR